MPGRFPTNFCSCERFALVRSPWRLLRRRRQKILGPVLLLPADKSDETPSSGNDIARLEARIPQGAGCGLRVLLSGCYLSFRSLPRIRDEFLRPPLCILYALLPHFA